MVFSSTLFLLYFFPIFFLVYFSIPSRQKNTFLLFASLLFFTWGAPVFIGFVLFSIVVDFYIVRHISRTSGKKKMLFLFFSVFFNIALLAYFKYANFFVENVNDLVSNWNANGIVGWKNVILPIGISFFTFKKISYCVDVYRNTHKPFEKIGSFALFILLFPELVAGPIVRFNEIADQIVNREKQETIDNKLTGLFRFIIGLSKKVLIANVLGAEVDKIFDSPVLELSTPIAWLGILAYTFQIYFDFSGYSDMAIGAAKMMGFTFPENFDNPYTSQSITEFWRRWHITLGRWMRDYLYIPLGGNKKSPFRSYFNLIVVFLLSGLWHGASWNFILWGAFHGIFLILDRLFLLKLYALIGKLPSVLITFFIVMIGWVFFRTEDLNDARDYLYKLFCFDFSTTNFYFLNDFFVVLTLATLFSFAGLFNVSLRLQNKILINEYRAGKTIFVGLVCLSLLIICISAILGNDFNPFIYYQF
jgi:alginate O-acetyltransferase complex protein AlgI